jgi:serpin B
MPPCEVDVYLPRFSIESDLRLDDALRRLGIPLAFERGSADFSGMNGRVADLSIGAALHKACVDVNEEGTTAAAATGIMMVALGLPEPPQIFRADHPFLFLIRDTRTKSILFFGRLVEPNH